MKTPHILGAVVNISPHSQTNRATAVHGGEGARKGQHLNFDGMTYHLDVRDHCSGFASHVSNMLVCCVENSQSSCSAYDR